MVDEYLLGSDLGVFFDSNGAKNFLIKNKAAKRLGEWVSFKINFEEPFAEFDVEVNTQEKMSLRQCFSDLKMVLSECSGLRKDIFFDKFTLKENLIEIYHGT